VGLVRHFVGFRYTNSTTAADKAEIIRRYTALFNLCTRPDDGQPYIVSFDAGFNASSEGYDQQIEHGFVVTFPSVEMRDYFVGRPFQESYDPNHDAFKAFVGPFLRRPIDTGLVVMDFSVAPYLGAPLPSSPALQPNSSTTIFRKPELVTNNSNSGMVNHMVSLRFLDSVSEAQREAVTVNITSLLWKSVRPDASGVARPYIVSLDAGVPNSKEGFQQNMDQFYLLTFASVSDRDYFVTSDAAHLAVKAFVSPLLRPASEGAFIFDHVVLPAVPVPPNALNNPNAGLVKHVVMFRYADSVTPDIRQQINTRYLALYNLCTRPSDGSLYIVSFDAGFNNSKEGWDQKMQDGFVVTFSSVSDRDYFVGRPFQESYDPNHDAFKAFVGPYLRQPIATGLVVMDFSVAPVLGLYPFPPLSSQPNSSTTIVRANSRVTDNPNSGLVHHLVTFRFSNATTVEQARSVITNYTSLFKKCVLPNTQTPYIVSFDAGAPNSKEGFDQQMEQLFLLTFPSVELRDYFVGRPFQESYDPFHDAFKAYVGPFLRQPTSSGLFVFDFSVDSKSYPVPDTEKKGSDHKTEIIIGSAAGAVLVLGAVVLYCYCKQRKQEKAVNSEPEVGYSNLSQP